MTFYRHIIIVPLLAIITACGGGGGGGDTAGAIIGGTIGGGNSGSGSNNTTATVSMTSSKTSIVAGAESAASVGCSIVYTLYDGPDAMIANKLLEKGFPVTEDTVNTYKVNLLSQQELMEGSL